MNEKKELYKLYDLLRQNNEHYLWDKPINKWTLEDISSLKKNSDSKKKVNFFLEYPIELINQKKELAQKRFEIIKPILENKNSKKLNLIKEISLKEKISKATLYRWIKLYNEHKTIYCLLGKPKNGGRGKVRLTASQQDIINKVLNKKFLKKYKKTNKMINLILDEFKKENILAPHSNTIRNRIKFLKNY